MSGRFSIHNCSPSLLETSVRISAADTSFSLEADLVQIESHAIRIRRPVRYPHKAPNDMPEVRPAQFDFEILPILTQPCQYAPRIDQAIPVWFIYAPNLELNRGISNGGSDTRFLDHADSHLWQPSGSNQRP